MNEYSADFDPETFARNAVKRSAEDRIIERAIKILEGRFKRGEVQMNSPADLKHYLSLNCATLEHEVFGVIMMDSQHAVIAVEELFRGSVSTTSVYPREVVKSALKFNAAAVAFYHNHPSGVSEPSRADEMLTQQLKKALEMVEIRTLDHFVVGHTITSFAERGLL